MISSVMKRMENNPFFSYLFESGKRVAEFESLPPFFSIKPGPVNDLIGLKRYRKKNFNR